MEVQKHKLRAAALRLLESVNCSSVFFLQKHRGGIFWPAAHRNADANFYFLSFYRNTEVVSFGLQIITMRTVNIFPQEREI